MGALALLRRVWKTNTKIMQTAVVAGAVFGLVAGPLLTAGTAFADTVAVSPGSSTALQDAINSATPGDIIQVAPGTYTEDVTVNKAVTLQGAKSGIDARSRSNTGESIVKSFNVTVSNVVIDGFSLNGTATQVNVSSPGHNTLLSGEIVKNNKFTGYGNVGLISDVAGNILIQKNKFSAPLAGSEAMQIKDNALLAGCTGTQVLDNDFVAATDNGGADVNLSCTDSGSTNVTVAGNNSYGNDGGSSFVAFSGVTGGITVSNNTATTSGSAVFFFGSVSGTVNITGNEITGGGGSAIALFGGDAGTSDTPNSGTFTISNNNLSENARAIRVTASGLTGVGQVIAHGNNFASNSIIGVANATSITLDVASNWWGTGVQSEIAALITGPATFTPWYMNSGRTILNTDITDGGIVTDETVTLPSDTPGQASLPDGVTEITFSGDSGLDLNDNAQSATPAGTPNNSLDQTVGDQTVTIEKVVVLRSGTNDVPLTIKNQDVPTITVELPDNTQLFATTGWDGVINPPTTVTTTTGTAPSGFSFGSTVLKVGSDTATLLFDKAVTLVLQGVSSPIAYQSTGSTVWNSVATCGGTYAAPVDPVFPGECSITNGTDTKILTFHFTTFAAVTANPATPTSSTTDNPTSQPTVKPAVATRATSSPASTQVIESDSAVAGAAEATSSTATTNTPAAAQEAAKKTNKHWYWWFVIIALLGYALYRFLLNVDIEDKKSH